MSDAIPVVGDVVAELNAVDKAMAIEQRVAALCAAFVSLTDVADDVVVATLTEVPYATPPGTHVVLTTINFTSVIALAKLLGAPDPEVHARGERQYLRSRCRIAGAWVTLRGPSVDTKVP